MGKGEDGPSCSFNHCMEVGSCLQKRLGLRVEGLRMLGVSGLKVEGFGG